MPNFVTPYVLAVIASAYLLGDTSQPDLQRSLGVRRSLWSFLNQHVPTSEKQAEQVGFRECWKEGLPFSEPMVLYQNTPAGVHPLYVRLVKRWVGNPAQQVWLKPSKVVQPVGFEPVYEYRLVQEHGKEVRKRVQVNKEVNAKVRRMLARAAKQEAWANLHTVAPEENGSHGEDSEDGDVLNRVLELMGKWKHHVAKLMLSVGTEDVYDVIQIPANCCEPLMLSICPDCEDFAFTEGAFEMDVTDYDALWTEKWYMKHCDKCLSARSASGFSHCTSLNGRNGEATNSDDVKRRGQQKKRGSGKKRQAPRTLVIRRARMGNSTRVSSNLYEKQYRLALMDPFHPHARGAKCTINPWQFTVPYCVRWKAQVTAPGGGSNLMILQPNPNFYGWSTVSSAVPTTIIPVLGPVLQIPSNAAVGMQGSLVSNGYPSFAIPMISSQLANFRVVAGGVMLRSMLASSIGQCLTTAVPVMVQNSDFAWDNLVTGMAYNNASSAGYWLEGGEGCNFIQESLLGSVYNNTNILNMGGTRSFTTYDLMMNEALMRFSPITPEAFHFHDCGEEMPTMVNGSGNMVGVGDIVDWQITGGPAVKGVAKRGITDTAGWSGVMIRNTNPNGAQVYLYEVDFVLHIEGQPRMGSQTPPAMASDIPASSESSILQYARTFRDITVETIQDLAGVAGRAATNAAINRLQTAAGGVTRAYARLV